MEKFLSGHLLQQAIRDALNSANVQCAVAFWGRGAEQSFGPKVRNAKIICNLNMGGTNPEPIRILREDVKRFNIRQCDTLHAKVYIGDRSAVVTSANNSTNGLGSEGAIRSGWIEAGVLLTDIDDLKAWFDSLWNNKVFVRQITDDDLLKASMFMRGSLLKPPRPAYVVIWSEDANPEGYLAWSKAEKEIGSKLGFYQDWDEIPEGADIFDFQAGERFFKYKGCWQTFEPQLVRSTRGGGHVTLCQRKRGDLFGKELKRADDWKSILRKIWEKNGDCVLRLSEPSLSGLVELSNSGEASVA